MCLTYAFIVPIPQTNQQNYTPLSTLCRAYAGILPIFLGLGLIFKANNSTQGKDATKSDVVLKSWQRPLLKLLCGASALPDRNAELAPLLINDDKLLSGGRR